MQNIEDHIDNENNAENEPSCTGTETSEMDESKSNAEQIASINVVDHTILNQFKEFKRSGNLNMAFPQKHRTEVELLSILKDAKAPMYVYNSIMQWAHQSAKTYGYRFKDAPNTRERVSYEWTVFQI